MPETLIILNGANPVHVAFGEAVGADSFIINERVMKKQFAPLKAFRLARNSLAIPSGYKTILCESCYYYPAIKKRFFGLKSRIININCGPLLYNIWSGKLRGTEGNALRSLLKEVDAHLVFGKYGVEVAERIDPGKPIGVVYPFIGDDRYNALFRMTPNLGSKEITIIGNDDVSCKGIDVAVEAFNIVLEHDKDLALNIVTNIDKINIDALDRKKTSRIRYTGIVSNVMDILAGTGLYIHPSRGDTFPRASLESMAAGIPSIVSVETGTKEIVENVDAEMVCKGDAEDLAQRMISYLQLSVTEKKKRSAAFREAAKPFNRKEQLENFEKQFKRLC
ncbi:MAG: glycosyltransferase family 4 protein [Candidatus ainarchaeum sp.]|nr:glycosyltransferase family 4 protein [Candidatus ainarchaeum sp.]